MFRRSLAPALVAGLTSLAAAAAPAAADVLVMKDGSRVETRGPWESRGAMLVFTLPSGALSSVKAANADLDASTAATKKAAEEAAAARQPKPEADTPKKEAVITITDADVAHVTDFPENADAAAAGEAAGEEATGEDAAAGGEAAAAAAAEGATGTAPAAGAQEAPPAVERLRIVSHRRDMTTSDGVTILGEVANASGDIVGNVQITVRLLDENGEMLATADALVGAATLQPNQRATFRASFPGIETYADVSFEIDHTALRLQPGAAPGN